MENPPFWRCIPYWKWELSIAMLVFKSVWYTYNTYNLRCSRQPGVSSKMAPYFERILRRYNVPFQAQAVHILSNTQPWLTIISHHTFGKTKKNTSINSKTSFLEEFELFDICLFPRQGKHFFFTTKRFPASFWLRRTRLTLFLQDSIHSI